MLVERAHVAARQHLQPRRPRPELLHVRLPPGPLSHRRQHLHHVRERVADAERLAVQVPQLVDPDGPLERVRVGLEPALDDELVRLQVGQHGTQDQRPRSVPLALRVHVHAAGAEHGAELAHLLVLPLVPRLADEPQPGPRRLPRRHPELSTLPVAVQVEQELLGATRAEVEGEGLLLERRHDQ
ncbi:MAG: hypothetical protein ACK41D_07180 [Rubricoccaceae bacterium]